LLGAHNKLSKKQDVTPPAVYEFNEAVMATGGFGRFQLISTLVLTLGLMTGSSIIFGVGYLIKYPEYDCKVGGQWTACDREHICDNGIAKQDWRFNYEGEGSFINWVERMDLTCTDKAIVAMPGSVFFAGFCVSAAILPRLSDVYGRHLPFFLCILV